MLSLSTVLLTVSPSPAILTGVAAGARVGGDEIGRSPRLTHLGVRDRLIASALALLSEGGPQSLSMREIARRSGVSHNAPLRHFRSFGDLLSAVAAQGFRLLNERLEETGSALPGGAGARARLVAVSHVYVTTAIEQHALFSLMFRLDLIDMDNEDYQREAMQSGRQFMRFIRAVQDEGLWPGVDTAVLNAVVWSQMHGIASLWSQGALAVSVGTASLNDVIDLALNVLFENMALGKLTTSRMKS
jgi:AcrR family transcriptional regulator